ncbi:MAG: NAD(P)H-dependent oxidoreductase subunit E [Gammaproteobacteria bacterium]|nr:NAD(P)H-dependent oxidoreductase subunit E [Gammaproteobacteria bacterium]
MRTTKLEKKPVEVVNNSDLMLISKQSYAAIDKWIAKYHPENRQAAVIPALHIVQEENGGHLTIALMDELALYLNMPTIAVYEVASFYSMFEHKPIGKHKVSICTNISCMLRGSEEIVEHLKKKFAINLGETTTDGKFTVKEVECLGACVGAPMCLIGREYHEYLTPEKIDAILEKLE